ECNNWDCLSWISKTIKFSNEHYDMQYLELTFPYRSPTYVTANTIGPVEIYNKKYSRTEELIKIGMDTTTIGIDTTKIGIDSTSFPVEISGYSFELLQNYPNPFNPR